MKILNGNNLDLLKTLDENSIDSIVTDPPYGLSFMNKKWDHSVPSVEFWQECFRVLKPGGHVLSFGGTRTYHRMAVNIEDAGFEIRDQIMWLYGSGFPKSQNVSKMIDKKFGCEREVVGISKNDRPKSQVKGGRAFDSSFNEGQSHETIFETKPSSDQAKKWDGFGTALKPANEPIVLARKPLSEKTIVDNVLKWGTGAINIDGTRILTKEQQWAKEQTLCDSCASLAVKNQKLAILETKESFVQEIVDQNLKEKKHGIQLDATSKTDTGCLEETSMENISINLSMSGFGKEKTDLNQKDMSSTTSMKTEKTTGFLTCNLCNTKIMSVTTQEKSGRWPSNIILDEQAASMFPITKTNAGGKSSFGGSFGNGKKTNNICAAKSEVGLASRFFYCAKASKSERNRGLEDLEKKEIQTNFRNGGFANPPSASEHPKMQNFHPTVKPIKLMEYLVKLITPPNGAVLDPFMGSGSTGVACKNLGFEFVGMELDPEYFKIAKKRIND